MSGICADFLDQRAFREKVCSTPSPAAILDRDNCSYPGTFGVSLLVYAMADAPSKSKLLQLAEQHFESISPAETKLFEATAKGERVEGELNLNSVTISFPLWIRRRSVFAQRFQGRLNSKSRTYRNWRKPSM
jgi:hypothetical protein